MFAAYFLKSGEIKPVASRMLTLDLSSPENIRSHALAVDPKLRQFGFATKLIEYSTLLLNHFRIAPLLEWNTNNEGIHVSGGFSPVEVWKRYGTDYGRRPDYNPAGKDTGDLIFFYANLQKLATRTAQSSQWSEWTKKLSQ